jgi:hypothetical protein
VLAAGVEIEQTLVDKFCSSISDRGLQGRVYALQGDLRAVDFVAATVVVLYLLPEALAELKSMLVQCLQRGARVVANTWGLPGVRYARRVQCGPFQGVSLFLYTAGMLSNERLNDCCKPLCRVSRGRRGVADSHSV